ncbi:hypothetical protein [Streptomyces tauricus]|uniref:hypothetical protein n=1 Tax=Streptomyces tauricus TaxID=68274 RepID=UPI0033A1D265
MAHGVDHHLVHRGDHVVRPLLGHPEGTGVAAQGVPYVRRPVAAEGDVVTSCGQFARSAASHSAQKSAGSA